MDPTLHTPSLNESMGKPKDSSSNWGCSCKAPREHSPNFPHFNDCETSTTTQDTASSEGNSEKGDDNIYEPALLKKVKPTLRRGRHRNSVDSQIEAEFPESKNTKRFSSPDSSSESTFCSPNFSPKIGPNEENSDNISDIEMSGTKEPAEERKMIDEKEVLEEKSAEIRMEILAVLEINQGFLINTENQNKILYNLTTQVSVKCFFKHTWNANLQSLKEEWCPKCKEILENVRKYATEKEGKILNNFYLPQLSFECKRGHKWQTSANKWSQKWCKDCKKIEQDQYKRQLQEEEERNLRERTKLQQKLFEEARQKLIAEQQAKLSGKPSQNPYAEKMIKYYRDILEGLEAYSTVKATEYIKSTEHTGDLNLAQLKFFFKILLIPEEIIRNYFKVLSNENLKKEFHFMAKSMHPDKNRHPDARIAFQKIYLLYTLAIKARAAPL